MLLQDKVVVLSDVGSDLGRAVAAACEREGASVVPAAETAWDAVDCLVLLCADSNLDDLRARVEAEVFEPLHIVKEAIVPMKRQRRGSIVFVNSSAHAAAWGALYTAVQVLAKELGRGDIRVNTVAPASAEPPEEVADVVVFFASDLSAIVTGQSLVVSA